VITAGADLWLNTPQRPMEASGTSGMKAAHNGVPSQSLLDGWWIEGHVEGVTGWSIGPADAVPDVQQASATDAADLYAKLEGILPLFAGSGAAGSPSCARPSLSTPATSSRTGWFSST
jgi:starch phosphorylase